MDVSIRNRNAFPQKQPRGAQIAYGDKPGMTLRQYYAGQALPAVIQAMQNVTEVGSVTPHSTIAEMAVAVADALCEELAKIS